MELSNILMLSVIGLVAGAWNAIAGGATLFSFPALMAAGLPPVVANATNYVALVPANIAALPAYKDELIKLGRTLIPMLVYSGLGAAVGSILLIVSDPALFQFLIPFLLAVATVLFAVGNRIRTGLVTMTGTKETGTISIILLFIVSIYGGYFGAGLGIVLLAIAQIMGHEDYSDANAIKNLVVTSFTFISVAIFGVGGIIAWPEAVVMMVGATIGGYAGGRIAKKINQTFLKGTVVVFGVFLTTYYFWRIFA